MARKKKSGASGGGGGGGGGGADGGHGGGAGTGGAAGSLLSTEMEGELTALQAIFEDDFAYDEKEHRQFRIRVAAPQSSTMVAVMVVQYVHGYPRKPCVVTLDVEDARQGWHNALFSRPPLNPLKSPPLGPRSRSR
jgi:hypothetical protein